ncbi:SRPBCC family protein [Chondromyces crocatus]|uniref:Cyclase/dehydrase n=1 Tax=Chondromyces crocatus TaxID=52 RepID=A0A0K1EJI9_CHOCO|nr:SRPBCC family protein [Chondromyces crocatus]AKT41036.1 cyclase/dehydrase [Chondromyces crocatus]
MPIYEKRSRIAATPERVFAFHEAPDALERLTPPWESARVLEKSAGIDVGAKVALVMRLGPVSIRWDAEHTAYEKGRMFQDVQRKGPFRKWEHTHTMLPDGEGGCWLVDRIDYEVPLGKLGTWVADRMVRKRLERMFTYRHDLTRRACEERT